MSALLIDGRFVAVFPRLVRALSGDVTAAALLQAIHYRMQALDSRREPWIALLLSEIADEIGISVDQAQRASKRLRDAGLLLVRGTRGETREWSIDYEEVVELDRGNAESRRGNAESRHYRRGIALPTSYIEEVEVEEDIDQSRKPVRKPVDDHDENFAAFWAAYPRKVAKGSARKAWSRAVLAADPSVIVAGAVRYASDPNREEAFTAHPSTWLNGERWLDDPLPNRDSRADRKVNEVEEMIRRAAQRDASREIES